VLYETCVLNCDHASEIPRVRAITQKTITTTATATATAAKTTQINHQTSVVSETCVFDYDRAKEIP